MIICIGPVCVPITAILPLLLFVFRPIYNRLSPENQKKCDRFIKDAQVQMNRFLKKIGWPWFSFCKKKKQKSGDTNGEMDENEMTSTDTKVVRKDNENTDSNTNAHGTKLGTPLFYQLTDNEEWENVINDSTYKNQPIFAYFTAEFSICIFKCCLQI